MTVTYSLNVANACLTGFSKLLLRWRGSIYKLLYREMLIFCGLYYGLSILYRYILKDSQRLIFEKLAIYCEAFTNLIPLSFVLGFYVSIVVTRWWQQYMQIPWPDKSVMLIAGLVHGSDERGRIIRRTLARYLLLLQTLTFQCVSTSIRKRFPTLDHVEEAGIMTKEERIAYDEVPGVHGKWWVPAQWYTALCVRARKEGRIKDDNLLKQILDELHVYRGCCGMMFAYDWISIPLVYTQTVTIATYTYFLATVMGRQYLDTGKGYSGHDVDFYVPVFTVLEFFFFMGWLKVAEQLINPYGEDDDDFELNWCLDRNLLISFWIVDEMHNKHPKLVKDIYWDELEPVLPYTKSSLLMKTQPHLGSAMRLDIDPEEAEFVPMETIMEDDSENTRYNSPLPSPNDLANPGSGLDLAKEKEEVSSQTGLRFPPEFPGSRFLNMIIGQSNENVSHTPTNKLDKNQHPLLPPFILKTPKKRSRTTSVADSLNQMSHGRLHPASSTAAFIPISSTNEFTRPGFGDIPTAPVIMNNNQSSFSYRRSPSLSKREINLNSPGDHSLGAIDIGRDVSNSKLNMGTRPDSVEEPHKGFRFPTAYTPPMNPQEYYPQHLIPKDENEEKKEKDVPVDQETPRSNSKAGQYVMPTITLGSRTSSRSGYNEIKLDVDNLIDDKNKKQDLKDSDEETVKPSPYEPNSSSSQESLTPYESNQSTVNSFTELLKKS